jgi:aminopeptidase N
MWVHEGFTNYSETLFTECEFGKEAGNDYLTGLRKDIKNDIPVIGPYGVNQEGSGDMYSKGANLLHNIRQIINDDEKFRKILRGLNATFYHKTVNSKDIEQYINKESGVDFSKVFDQYLRTTKIPVLEYKFNKNSVSYRWTNCIDGFDMKVKIKLNEEKEEWLQPLQQWNTLELPKGYTPRTFLVDRNFYVTIKKTK